MQTKYAAGDTSTVPNTAPMPDTSRKPMAAEMPSKPAPQTEVPAFMRGQ